MKKEEREHLKEDLLVSFVEKNLKRMSKHKKPILIGIIAFFSLVILLTVISLLNAQSIKTESETYTRAVLIRFDSKDDFETWYQSDEYQGILKHRLSAAECDTILIRGKR